jgi:hypothetical protein
MKKEQTTKKSDTREAAKKQVEEKLTLVALPIIREAASIMVEGLADQKESLATTNKAVEDVSSRVAAITDKQATDHAALSTRQKATDDNVATNSERLTRVELRQSEVSRLKVQAQAASTKADEAKAAVEAVEASLKAKPEDDVASRVSNLETTYDTLDRKVEDLASAEPQTQEVGSESFQEMARGVFEGMINEVKEGLNALRQEVEALKGRLESAESKPEAAAEVTPKEKPEATEPEQPEPVVSAEPEAADGKPKLSVVPSADESAAEAQEPEPDEAVEPAEPEAVSPDAVDDVFAEAEMEGVVSLDQALEKSIADLEQDVKNLETWMVELLEKRPEILEGGEFQEAETLDERVSDLKELMGDVFDKLPELEGVGAQFVGKTNQELVKELKEFQEYVNETIGKTNQGDK